MIGEPWEALSLDAALDATRRAGRPICVGCGRPMARLDDMLAHAVVWGVDDCGFHACTCIALCWDEVDPESCPCPPDAAEVASLLTEAIARLVEIGVPS